MIKTQFKGVRQILCLGAHPDDIEIGCGGTLLRLLAENKDISVFWAVMSKDALRDEEAVKSAELFLNDAKQKTIVLF